MNSIAITKSKEAPFSFYERDKQKHMERLRREESAPDDCHFGGIKANPVPAHVSMPMMGP